MESIEKIMPEDDWGDPPEWRDSWSGYIALTPDKGSEVNVEPTIVQGGTNE